MVGFAEQVAGGDGIVHKCGLSVDIPNFDGKSAGKIDKGLVVEGHQGLDKMGTRVWKENAGFGDSAGNIWPFLFLGKDHRVAELVGLKRLQIRELQFLG